MMRKANLVIALLGVISGCGKAPSSPSARVADQRESGAAPGWLVYEDDWFRVAYPEGSEIGGTLDGKQVPESPTFFVIPPAAEYGIRGAFTIQFDRKTRGMLLRDAIALEISGKAGEHKRIVAPPREVKVKNGRCLSAGTTELLEGCGENRGSCYLAQIVTLCDDSAGRRYTATTVLSDSTEPGSLSPRAREQAALYERILRSLEFKKS